MDVVVPRTKPIAPYTWEIAATLLATEEETADQPLDFTWPARIIGVRPSVSIAASPTGLLVPTADDLLVQLTVDKSDRFTARQEGRTSAGDREEYMCTLAALDTRFRELGIVLDAASPTVRMRFRWKLQDPTIWVDSFVAVSLFIVPEHRK